MVFDPCSRSLRQTILALEPLEDRCVLAFGTGGIVTVPAIPDAHWAFLQPDGKIVATTSTGVSKPAGTNFTAVRINSTGSLDTTFGLGGITQANAAGAAGGQDTYSALQADGKIVTTGWARIKLWEVFPTDFVTVRFTANGQVDKTIDKSGKSVVHFADKSAAEPQGILVQPWDNKVLVVGLVGVSEPNPPRLGMVRYTPSGGRDSSFGSGGTLLTAPLGERAVGVAAHEGKVLVALEVGSRRGVALRRFNPDGSPDTTWGTGGRVLTPVPPGMEYMGARRVLVQPNGKILVFGSILTYETGLLLRYNADGSPDPTFGAGTGYVMEDGPAGDTRGGFALQADGKIVVASSLRVWNPTVQDWDFRALLRRYNADGTPDTSFNGTGRVITLYRTSTKWDAVMVQSDGKIVTAGGYYDRNTGEGWRMLFARFNSDGSLDDSDPLLAGGTAPDNSAARSLSDADLQPLLREAFARWQTAGADTSTLAGLTVRIADLGGATLGLASSNTILIDADAAGYGWFIDPTPWDDREFLLPGDQGEQGRIDLLTVLLHEIGHLLGRDHTDEGVMQPTLAAGRREKPPSQPIDTIFAELGSWLTWLEAAERRERRVW